MLTSTFQLAPELIEILEKKGKEMISGSISKEIVTIPNTKMKVILIKSGSEFEEKYADNIFKQLEIDGVIFYISR